MLPKALAACKILSLQAPPILWTKTCQFVPCRDSQRQFPVSHSYTTTVYKIEDLTLECAIVGLFIWDVLSSHGKTLGSAFQEAV